MLKPATCGHRLTGTQCALSLKTQVLSCSQLTSSCRIQALRVEKLQGDRKGQWSVRVSRGLRLLYARKKTDAGRVIVAVELFDYH